MAYQKKLFATLASASLFASITSVVACTYVNTYVQSVENRVKDLIETSSLAMCGPIAGAAGSDGVESANYLQGLNVNDVVSGSNEKQPIAKALSSYFGNDFDIYKTIASVDGLSSDQKKEMNGHSYEANTWGSVSGIFNTIYSLVGSGISNSFLSTLVSTLKLVGVGGMNGDTVNNLNAIIEKISSASNGLKVDIEKNLGSIQTNQDYMCWFYQELSILLHNLYGDDSSPAFAISDISPRGNNKILDWAKILNVKIKNKDTGLGIQFQNVFNSKKTAAWSNSQDIGPIIEMIMALSCYLNAFNEFVNPNLKNNDNWTEDDHNHIFSQTDSNYTVISKVAATPAKCKKITECDLSIIPTLLNAIVGGQGSVDKLVYNRIFQILFQNIDTVDGARLITTPSSGDGTSNPAYKNEKDDSILLSLHESVDGDGKKVINYGNPSIRKKDNKDLAQHMYGLGPLLSSLLYALLISNKTIIGNVAAILYGFIPLLQENDAYEAICAIISNIIMPILANDNCQKLISSIGTDLCGLLNSSIIAALKNILPKNINIPSSADIAPYLPVFAVVGSYFNRPLEDLLYGSKLVPLVFTILAIFNIQIPDNFKNYKNLTDFLKMKVSIFGVNMSISSITSVLIEVLAMVSTNANEIMAIVNCLTTDMPKDINVYDANGTLISKKGADKSSVTFNNKTYNNKLILGLAAIDESYKGYQYQYTTSDNKIIKISGLQFGAMLLGYSTTDNSVIPDSFLGLLQKIANKTGEASLNKLMGDLKTFFSVSSSSFYTDRNKKFMDYMAAKNYTISDIAYQNFGDTNYESKLSYIIHYNYNNVSLEYRISIILPPGVNQKYQIYNIEKIYVPS